MQRELVRIGIDRPAASATGKPVEWAGGRPMRSFPVAASPTCRRPPPSPGVVLTSAETWNGRSPTSTVRSSHRRAVHPRDLGGGSADPHLGKVSMYTFGAHFAEVRVREDTGEVRVPRLLGMYDADRIVNPKTARSQLLGGLTGGLSMALHEHSVTDPRFGM